jgi:hypothetical protein
VHALAQQTPCAQKPELHSAPAPHVAPIGFLPQLMLLQLFGDVQSVLDEQLVRQALLVPHWYGSHADGVDVRQVPVPLHVRAGVKLEPVQRAAAQVVPAA